MTPQLTFPGAVVVGLDRSPAAEDAVRWAGTQARLEQRPLVLVHAAGPLSGLSTVTDLWRDDLDTAAHRTRDLLREGRRLLTGTVREGHDVRLVVAAGSPRSVLPEVSAGASALVLGAPVLRGTGATVAGSVAGTAVMGAACPVVVVRHGRQDPAHPRVAVGTDGTELSAPALAFAFRTAEARSWGVTVIHCFWDSTGLTGDVDASDPRWATERARLEEEVAPHRHRHPDVEVALRLSRGFADERLVAASDDHALVVVGHHRLPLLQRVVWGNVTPLVVRHASGDVAVVPAGLHDTQD
jgi:nucleotide-binding universal stress UspA family protein